MALYSVWDWDRNAYAIYSTPTRVSVGDDPVPPRPRTSGLGADPDLDVKPLPLGAKLMGYDHLARGEVRRKRSALGAVGDDGSAGSSGTKLLMFVAGVAAGYALTRWWRKR